MGNLINKDRYISSAESKNSKATDVSTSFLEHKSSLKKYISRYINHPHDIEDIVHEAFLKTYAAEIKAKIQKPKAYLFTTAKNLALKHLTKSSYRLTDYLEDLEPSKVYRTVPSVEETVEGHEQFALFCKAVQKLPLQCRRVFILRKVYDLSHKEIAKRLDISVSTIEKHLANGISKCSDFMHSRGYTYSRHQAQKQMNSTDGKSKDKR